MNTFNAGQELWPSRLATRRKQILEVDADMEARTYVYQAADAARGAIRFIQCREAKGQDPTSPEFGTAKWKRFSGLFGEDEDAWEQFIHVVDDALTTNSVVQSRSPMPAPSTITKATATTSPSHKAREPEAEVKKGLLNRLFGR